MRNGEARVVVGTRSAVFAPLENVGLIIVDEEQESSYKQEETPRYNGRDVAVVRAKLEGAVALLGSATPSLESFHHARPGKYKLLRLDARIENRPMAPRRNRGPARGFSPNAPRRSRFPSGCGGDLASGSLPGRSRWCWSTAAAIPGSRCAGVAAPRSSARIAASRSPITSARTAWSATTAGFRAACPRRARNAPPSTSISSARAPSRSRSGCGRIFPQARIARLDRDTARSKRAFEQVLGAFAAGRIDILVGTQMVAKGHDFQRVTLVGVVSADAQLGFPDFRAAERTFQLLTQVAGRAGRGALAGEVLVETHYPEHYAIQLAARQDYPSFFEKELQFRRLMHYPPFAALASLLVRDTESRNRAIRWSRQIGAFLEPMESRGIKVLGPAAAPLARLKREYRFQFLLKSPRRAALHQRPRRNAWHFARRKKFRSAPFCWMWTR